MLFGKTLRGVELYLVSWFFGLAVTTFFLYNIDPPLISKESKSFFFEISLSELILSSSNNFFVYLASFTKTLFIQYLQSGSYSTLSSFLILSNFR